MPTLNSWRVTHPMEAYRSSSATCPGGNERLLIALREVTFDYLEDLRTIVWGTVSEEDLRDADAGQDVLGVE